MSELVPKASLGILCDLVAGGTPSTNDLSLWSDDPAAGYPWIAIGDMSRRKTVSTTAKHVSAKGLEKARLPVGEPGTVLFAIYASVGETAILNTRATWNQAILGLSPKDRATLDSKFLYYAILNLRPELPIHYRSNTQHNLNAETVSRLQVPLPSLETQRRIADYLDRETGQIDAMIDKLDELAEQLKLRAQRVVDEAIFNGSQPASLGYAVDCLPGFSFKSSEFSHNVSDIPLLRGVNVKPGRLDWSETVYWPDGMADGLGEYYLQSGDIVLGMDRPFIGSGTRVVQILDSDPESLLVQRVLRIRPLVGTSSRYIYHAIKSKAFEFYVTPETTGISVPHISESQVRDFKVPLPPLEEQRRIADHLDDVTSKIDAMLAKVAELKDLLTERRAALITDVVTGRKDVA